MPSLGEAPSGGARALWLLWGFSKVTRRKGGTHSSRDRNNGYVLNPTQKAGQPRDRHRGQAPSHIGSPLHWRPHDTPYQIQPSQLQYVAANTNINK